MPFSLNEIEPLHIGLVVVAVIVLVLFLCRKKDDPQTRKLDDDLRKGVDDPLSPKKDPVLPEGIAPAVSDGQSEPATGRGENDRQTEFDFGDRSVDVSQPDVVAPALPAVRSRAFADPGIDAVVIYTPKSGAFFSPEVVNRLSDRIRNDQNSADIVIDFYDADRSNWTFDAQQAGRCTQIQVSHQLVSRSRIIDEIAASTFATFADQWAIELDAEFLPIDSAAMTEKAKKIRHVIETFDKFISIHLRSEAPLDREALASAAFQAGFTSSDGKVFSKSEDQESEPTLFLTVSDDQPNIIEYSIDVALSSQANRPLTQFFAIANELCCRLNATMTDARGNPVSSATASLFTYHLNALYDRMRDHGVSSGSSRAKRLFSRR